MAAHQSLRRRCTTSVRYELKARLRFLLEEHAGNMPRTANAGMPLRRLIRVRLRPSDEFLQILRRHGFLCSNQQRGLGEKRDWFEIISQVVLERIESAVCDKRVPLADDECVPVRRSARDATNADGSICASDVLNDGRLAERHLYVLTQKACDRICRPSRRIRSDNGDGAGWVRLRASQMRRNG